jgi:hypothetical protein
MTHASNIDECEISCGGIIENIRRLAIAMLHSLVISVESMQKLAEPFEYAQQFYLLLVMPLVGNHNC